jgi:hypothetical protein
MGRIGHNSQSVQNAMVLEHLIRRGPITPQEALIFYGCFRLAARIYDLRQVGHHIITTRVMNEHGNPYAEYHLLKQAERERGADENDTGRTTD